MPTLAQRQIEGFEKNGFSFPVEALTESEAAGLRDTVLQHLADCRRLGGARAALAFGPKVHLLARWAHRLVRHPALLEIAESMLGPDILVWGTQIFLKEPGGATDLAWHQDALTYDLDSDGRLAAFRVWLALTPTSVENGTLRFAAGTHRDGIRTHRRAPGLKGMMRGDEAAFDESEFERHDVVLRPGQCSLHHMLVVHGSGRNRTDETRVAFAIDYLAPSVRPSRGQDSALLVQGEDTHGHFVLEQAPQDDLGDETLALCGDAVRMRVLRLQAAEEERKKSGALTHG
ncbi:phytanoyl-CoA dioxygenase family protein [Streptomyces sp. NPDC006193]|uniref:phytanoyl-CoA dioxygenase family protein n=1 Tax=Streptomyces sp. NPDC006193 TaxID=3155717 RepID=UPI0033BF5317